MLKRIMVGSVTLMLLGGCAGQQVKEDAQQAAPVEQVTQAEKAQDEQGWLPIQTPASGGVEIIPITEDETSKIDDKTLSSEEAAVEGQSIPLAYEPVIYFAYDSDNVTPEGREILKYYADKLLAQPNVRVRLEGHTDERGSPEYNLALGERRAKAVQEVLVLYGVTPDRIEVVSYGETHPAVAGHDEAAWAKNRRVELVFVK